MNSAPPPGLRVFERGWLSSNLIYLGGDAAGAVVVDTGYCSHADQTLELLAEALKEDSVAASLRLVVNTHLHSDHCGGNAALQARHSCPVWVPAGQFEVAREWDESRLSYRLTGQQCPRFRPDAPLAPGNALEQAGLVWQAHAAPGHDPHSLLLFEAESRTLISADALWERGFGIVFPEIDGHAAFDEVELSLGCIESLEPALVIPGHGAPFADVDAALREARSRLGFFRSYPERHARHAARALIMFRMLDVRSCAEDALMQWLASTPIHASVWRRFFDQQSMMRWSQSLIEDLLSGGGLKRDGELLSIR